MTSARLIALWLIAFIALSALLAGSAGCDGRDASRGRVSDGAWGERAPSRNPHADDAKTSSTASKNKNTSKKPTPQRLAAGKRVTRHICSECHGMRDQDFKEVTPPGRGNHKAWKMMKNGWISIGPRPRESWERSVKRMVEVDSAVISRHDQQLIVEWLSTEYGDGE